MTVRGLLGRAYEALRRIFTTIGKPRFRFVPFAGERNLEAYNESRSAMSADFDTLREEMRSAVELMDSQFNVAEIHKAELMNMVGRALSKATDIAILQDETALTAIAAGDDFLNLTKIDRGFPLSSPMAFVDTANGFVTLSRTATESVINPESVEISVAKLSPSSNPGDADTFDQLHTFYEGKFAALLGQAEPEGGTWHIEDFPARDVEDGYEYSESTVKHIEKNDGTVRLHEETTSSTVEGATPNPIGLVSGRPNVSDPTANANQLLTRDRGASEEEKKKIRRRMVDGEPDSYWQCEWSTRPTELADRDLRDVALNPNSQPEIAISSEADVSPEQLRAAALTLDETDLVVSVTLTLPEPVDLNWLSLTPMNFGETTWLKIRNVQVADSRSSEFKTIPGFGNGISGNILTEDVNAEIVGERAQQILTPSPYSYRGTGVWAFATMRVQKIRIELVQEVPIPVLYQRINVQMHRLRQAVDDYVRSSDQQTKETRTDIVEEWTKTIALTYLQSVRIYSGNVSMESQSPGSDPTASGSGHSAADTPSGFLDDTHSRTSTWIENEQDTGWYIRAWWAKTYYDRLAYRIGIREIAAYRMRYTQKSEIVSIPFVSPSEIGKVTLRVSDHIPEIGTTIRYEVSGDDGKTWHRMNPMDKPTVHGEDGYAVPRILSWNIPGVAPTEQKYVVTEQPVRQIRFRAILTTNKDTVSPILRCYRLILYPAKPLSGVE